jgi:hypothetical protein
MAPRAADRPSPFGAVLEGLKLARRELAGRQPQIRPACRWVPVALVSALQAGLVAALSGYESAGEGDVTDPAQPDRFAPIALLLRRARSTKYLNPPELLELPGRLVTRGIETLGATRNAVLHGPDASQKIPEVNGSVPFCPAGSCNTICLTSPLLSRWKGMG